MIDFNYVRYIVEYEVVPLDGCPPYWTLDMSFDELDDARQYAEGAPAKTRIVKVRGELVEE